MKMEITIRRFWTPRLIAIQSKARITSYFPRRLVTYVLNVIPYREIQGPNRKNFKLKFGEKNAGHEVTLTLYHSTF